MPSYEVNTITQVAISKPTFLEAQRGQAADGSVVLQHEAVKVVQEKLLLTIHLLLICWPQHL